MTPSASMRPSPPPSVAPLPIITPSLIRSTPIPATRISGPLSHLTLGGPLARAPVEFAYQVQSPVDPDDEPEHDFPRRLCLYACTALALPR
jgi:hypothetical protein